MDRGLVRALLHCRVLRGTTNTIRHNPLIPSRQLSSSSDDSSSKDKPPKGEGTDDGRQEGSQAQGDVEKKGPSGKQRKMRAMPPTLTGDPVKAKAKLSELLQNIVKEQEAKKKAEEVGEDNHDKGKEIAFKLARRVKPKLTPEEIQAIKEERLKEKEIGQEVLSAVKKVAAKINTKDAEEQKVVENELVNRLRSHTPSKLNLQEVFEGMKVDATEKKVSRPEYQETQDRDRDLSRGRRVRDDWSGPSGPPQQRGRFSRPSDQMGMGVQQYRPIDIFGSQPLGIFTKGKQAPKSEVPISYLKTWDALQAKDLKLSATHPPANGFEEMIMWTEQGKLWHFPIDNEQGLDNEAKSSFTDHVFLEPNIDPWCPKKGPIRHFMELVCIGLSKNSYLTVQEKKDHLEWYHLYFKNKADIIKEVGAGEIK